MCQSGDDRGPVYRHGTALRPRRRSPYTSNEAGPMGTDHSAYAPVRDETGQIIGVMIVGVYVRSMAR